jgi:hypothetical protein
LKIESCSFVFQAKIENILEKNYKRKKTAFRHFIPKAPQKETKKRKRLNSLVFSLKEIQSSMSEKLSSLKDDDEIAKDFSHEKDYKKIRLQDFETRKINEKIPGIDAEFGWSG